MEEQELKQYLLNHFDCYADTSMDSSVTVSEPAITIPRFIEIIKNLDPNFIISNG